MFSTVIWSFDSYVLGFCVFVNKKILWGTRKLQVCIQFTWFSMALNFFEKTSGKVQCLGQSSYRLGLSSYRLDLRSPFLGLPTFLFLGFGPKFLYNPTLEVPDKMVKHKKNNKHYKF